MLVIRKNNYFSFFNKMHILIDNKQAGYLDFKSPEKKIEIGDSNLEKNLTIKLSVFKKTIPVKGNSTIIIDQNRVFQVLFVLMLISVGLFFILPNFINSIFLQYALLICPVLYILSMFYYTFLGRDNLLEIKVID